MKFLKNWIYIIIALASASNAFAAEEEAGRFQQEPRFERELNERDSRPLQDFLDFRSQMTKLERYKNLVISGDMRFEYEHEVESQSFRRKGNHSSFSNHMESLRGHNSRLIGGIPVSRNTFYSEFNFKVNYSKGRSWANAHLTFDNEAGVGRPNRDCDVDRQGCHGSGISNSIKLKRAYIGYNPYVCNNRRIDIEVGRRKLYDIFESDLEFDSRFDGVLVKYTDKIEGIADSYWKLAAFVVDLRVNQYAFATELGFLNVMDTGFGIKYSFIHWPKWHGRNRCRHCCEFANQIYSDESHKHKCGIENPLGWRFGISQVYMEYFVDPDLIGTKLQFYGAFLHNHFATKKLVREFSHGKVKNRRLNNGWYVGFILGEVEEAGDWSVDVEYQVVQAQAVPEAEVAGIGRGNISNDTFTFNGRGETNFKGVKGLFIYALTDELTVETILEASWAENARVGGRHYYSNLEITAIYAF